MDKKLKKIGNFSSSLLASKGRYTVIGIIYKMSQTARCCHTAPSTYTFETIHLLPLCGKMVCVVKINDS